mmetsp:Transcript_32437/g.33062  ORF Transcript_32437/g.33062 Transcript_32437/m.33062 type:complete len:789 (+) Transcript_32437:82-2448(+)|eukprot:CAMPEP_0182416486 /NCGR_PEP_ID=MMETSP1167-20130531/782_1 /TAXON_ID=2988 /ORGANISM="Mallomonas Sp, Strain CCMP3275" /LENGTH=788 /DNA_ID=CAMNT_0024589289 /DNA_START=23 /DNA_END=2389 /DNA_ORIENTATION=-
MTSLQLRVANLPNQRLAYVNRVYMSQTDFEMLKRSSQIPVSADDPFINISISSGTTLSGSIVFLASPYSGMEKGELGVNAIQRKFGSFTLNQIINVTEFIPTTDVALQSITIFVDLLKKSATNPPLTLEWDELMNSFKLQFHNQIFSIGQQIAMDFNGIKLDLCISSFEHATIDSTSTSTQTLQSSTSKNTRGQLLNITDINWKKSPSALSQILFTGGTSVSTRNDSLFKKDFDFTQMGIGGLGNEFQTIFRRAFASRIFPGLVKQLGINHVRGMLLYGPPGCGKTLIARQIGKILNAREPKIINGPEVLDKFVGGTEEKIRELFIDAEKEQAEAGDSSMLHIIIFDEMDAIMKQRGSTRDSTGVSDSMVNQLLAKIDGVDSLNNILIIGMTNRKDMIDEAILRPGRLELHVEIGLPDSAGRLQIINIHTSKMRESGRISETALNKLNDLADMTKNFTGAEIEGLVRSAASFALARNIDASSLSGIDPKELTVEWSDFERSLGEVTPAFGNKDSEEIKAYYRNGVYSYGPAFDDLMTVLERLVNQTRTSTKTPLLSVLLEGPVSTGKTAIAAKLCLESGFPFVRMISADSMIGNSESQKCQTLLRIFTDAYKSPLSVIFIDDIERIIEYSPIGPRFSNTVVQTLMVLLRKVPPVAGRRLLVVATTSISHLLDDLQITQAFHVTQHVGRLQRADEVASILEKSGLSASEVKDIVLHALSHPSSILSNLEREREKDINISPIGVKQLLMVLEMARSGEEEEEEREREREKGEYGIVTPERFLECLHTCGF